ncbi:hypothetical protein GF354_00520, partial [Candidatus Peregrinibacteria bacterium]|nr:hypothetical protein [Candidatus Peregrinibacteria bacterium]
MRNKLLNLASREYIFKERALIFLSEKDGAKDMVLEACDKEASSLKGWDKIKQMHEGGQISNDTFRAICLHMLNHSSAWSEGPHNMLLKAIAEGKIEDKIVSPPGQKPKALIPLLIHDIDIELANKLWKKPAIKLVKKFAKAESGKIRDAKISKYLQKRVKKFDEPEHHEVTASTGFKALNILQQKHGEQNWHPEDIPPEYLSEQSFT